MILSALDERILALTGQRDLPRSTIMRQTRLAGYTALEVTQALEHLGRLDLIERVGHIDHPHYQLTAQAVSQLAAGTFAPPAAE